MQKDTSHLEETLQVALAIPPALFEFASPSLQYPWCRSCIARRTFANYPFAVERVMHVSVLNLRISRHMFSYILDSSSHEPPGTWLRISTSLTCIGLLPRVSSCECRSGVRRPPLDTSLPLTLASPYFSYSPHSQDSKSQLQTSEA